MPEPFDIHDQQRSEVIVVGRFSFDTGEWYAEHSHDQHQLIWARSGVLGVKVDDLQWVLPTNRALWIPAGVPHQTGASTPAEMASPFILPERCDVPWSEPTPVVVDQLLGALIIYLAGDLDAAARERAERVVLDVLQPAPSRPIRIPLPADDRARAVADLVIQDPGDRRTLDELARSVGTSRRTLTRLFAAETGMPFHAWRAQVRVHASIALLASGHSVSRAALTVGYTTPSSFATTFRRLLGIPPSAYARSSGWPNSDRMFKTERRHLTDHDLHAERRWARPRQRLP